MNNNIKKDVFDFIVKCSTDEKVMCDYYELRDNVKTTEDKLSIAIKELKKENKMIANDGEYLPKEESKEK